MRRYIKLLIVVQLLCTMLIYKLYTIDYDSTSLRVYKQYILNEMEYIYDNSSLESLLEINRISVLDREYNNLKQYVLIWDDTKTSVHCMEEVNRLYEKILPDNIDDANEYIRPYIYTQTCYDILQCNKPSNVYYWEIQAEYLKIKSLHEIYLYRNLYNILYNNFNTILVMLYTIDILSYLLMIILCQINRSKYAVQ